MDAKWPITAEQLSEIVKNRDASKEQLSSDELVQKLHTNVHHGLSADTTDIANRQQYFGSNRLDARRSRTFFEFFFDALKDETLIILMVASVISIVLGVIFPPKGETREASSMEGIAILITVFIVAGVTATNDFAKDKQFQTLEAVNDDRKIKVIRAGKVGVISTFDIVVGDILQLETGDYIPADALLITSQSMSVDESSMTGEPEAVHKGESDRFLLSGCMVMEGFATAVVIAVGKYSQWGRIKAALTKEDNNTPLQDELEKLAAFIGKIGTGAAALTFVALLLRFTIEHYGIDNEGWEWSDLSRLVSFLIVAITIIVVAVPEGLPLAVTLSLAYSMIRMMKDQNLVRHLIACETMGSATCICSDKTGTLTQNRMTVVKLWLAESTYDDMSTAEKNQSELLKNLLCEGVSVNSTASVETGENGQTVFIGAKTECALLVLAQKFGFDYQAIRDTTKELRLFPFSSSKKRMSTLIQEKNDQHKAKLYCKGASEVVLELCSKWIDGKGDICELDAEKKTELKQLIDDWAGQGLRTLTLAYREVAKDDLKIDDPKLNLDEDLTLVGIVGIEDPLREEVPTSISQCKRAGITVRMLTGDNILTAKTIGKRCGILSEDGVALEGPSFRQMSSEEIDRIIPHLQIIARCSPEDKLMLVKHLRARGEVVGVTGDGTNDAPILREADVGFAMGLSGTEVAKSAADVIILDDNFASIEKAVLWGRNVYDSIQKFIQFQLTVNVVALVIAFLGAITRGYSPLNAIELLWVNLIMDTLAALALATESPTIKLLDRPPHGRNTPLISKSMWRTIIGCSVLQLAVLFFLLYAPVFDSEAKRRSMIFNVFVFLQLFNEINCRKLGNDKNIFEHILSNPIFLGVFAMTVVVQVLLVQFAGTIMQTVALSAMEWLICVAVGSVALPWGVIVRFIPIGNEKTEQQPEEEEHGLLQFFHHHDHAETHSNNNTNKKV